MAYNVLCLWFENLYLAGLAAIQYEVLGSAPECRLVVDWKNVFQYNFTNFSSPAKFNARSFQVKNF